MTTSLKIAVADDEQYMRDYLRELLPRLGHEVVVAEGGRQLVELCLAFPPDLVVTDIKMADMDGIRAAEEVNREREIPVILISAHHEPELRERAMQDHVMAYLVKPVKQSDLEAAIDLARLRFGHYQALRKESADLRQALEDRKLIERAKGTIMERLRIGEEDAFRRLRRFASERNFKLAEVARQIVEAEEGFRVLS